MNNVAAIGFMPSWRMLTRDKGWIKPILVLTLVGWIPILGQIAIMGYAYEWARLTAWNIESAPKQRGVDYGKVLSSGGRAFLISLLFGLIWGAIGAILFPGMGLFSALPFLGMGEVSELVLAGTGAVLSFGHIVYGILGLVVGAFIMAACMRATIYDDFAAGWRLDRLFEMIGRDFPGFMKVYLVTLIAAVISWVWGAAIGLIAGVVFLSGFAGVAMGYSMGYGFHGAGFEDYLLSELLAAGPGLLLLLVILGVLVAFIGGVIATALQLVQINAMGQWFNRFDVKRWGVSSAPLPADVPRGSGAAEAPFAPPIAPVPPQTPGAAQAAESASATVAAQTPIAPLDSEDSDSAQADRAGLEDETAMRDGHQAIPLPPVSTEQPPAPPTEVLPEEDDTPFEEVGEGPICADDEDARQ